MPEPFTTYKNNVAAAWLYVQTDIHNFYNDMYDLAGQLAAESWAGASQAVYNACIHLWDLRDHISGGDPSMRITVAYCFNWIDAEWPTDGAEVTMSAILDALWKAEPWQTLLFVPMVDAMRGSISEKTVTSQWMADALKHFM